MILRVLGPPRGNLEEGTENDLKKLLQRPSFLGSYFGAFWFPNLIFDHFICVNFYVYFWHRFREASASIFEDFGVISGCLLQ